MRLAPPPPKPLKMNEVPEAANFRWWRRRKKKKTLRNFPAVDDIFGFDLQRLVQTDVEFGLYYREKVQFIYF